jgi:hypothetical protein
MVQILEDAPSFSQLLGRSLGGVAGAALAGTGASYLKKKEEEKESKAFEKKYGYAADKAGRSEYFKQLAKMKAAESLFSGNFGKTSKPDFASEILSQEDKNKKFLEIVPQIEAAQNRHLDEEELEKVWESLGEPVEKKREEIQISPEDEEHTQRLKDYLFPEIAKGERERENIARKKFEADRTYHAKRSSKFLDKVTELSEGLRERKVAIDSSIAAVQSGQMSPLGGDFWADVLHAPALKSASGAQLEAGAKINLLGSLGKAGARPNQFIEQKIDQAFAKAGNTKEAQMAKLLLAKTVMDLDQAYIDVASRIAQEDREKYGYVKEDIDSRVEKEMKSISKEKMDELSFALQENVESDIGRSGLAKDALKPVMKGTYLTPEMANVLADKLEGAGEDKEAVIKLARRLGYEIPSESFLEKMGYVKE